ncbi:MAG: small subunit ribosomal protein [Chthoniobacter sp.]|jgi:ribosomal protein S6|nr:small subunit ribosomal protein [Chthoniobacter sp.]
MKNRYEGLLVLNTQGSEESAKEIIERLEGDFKKEGAKVEQVQKMDRKMFSYAAGALDAGYFVNFIFEADSQLIDKLRAKFKLDSDVYRQHFQKLIAKKPVKERGGKPKAAKEKTAKTE